jgi:hypothetical protein
MMRRAFTWAVVLAVGVGSISESQAQARPSGEDHWVAAGSMTGLLEEGYRLVSVVAPSPQLRIFFLSKEGLIAKCSEEPRQPPPPPPPVAGSKGRPNFEPRDHIGGAESKIDCSRLSKGR